MCGNCLSDYFLHRKIINQKDFPYLENSIFVDFGCKNLEKKKKFLGYVDLSEKGDCLEALYNLYNILNLYPL